MKTFHKDGYEITTCEMMPIGSAIEIWSQLMYLSARRPLEKAEYELNAVLIERFTIENTTVNLGVAEAAIQDGK